MTDREKFWAALGLALLSLGSAATALAEDPVSQSASADALGRWSFGIAAEAQGSDLGSGLYVNTPALGDSNLSLSLNMNTFEYSNAQSNDVGYTNLQLAVLGHDLIGERFGFYTRVGAGALFPQSALASKVGAVLSANLGIEFFPHRDFGGGVFQRLSVVGEFGMTMPLFNWNADQVPGSPHYAAGAMTSLGIRIYLGGSILGTKPSG